MRRRSSCCPPTHRSTHGHRIRDPATAGSRIPRTCRHLVSSLGSLMQRSASSSIWRRSIVSARSARRSIVAWQRPRHESGMRGTDFAISLANLVSRRSRRLTKVQVLDHGWPHRISPSHQSHHSPSTTQWAVVRQALSFPRCRRHPIQAPFTISCR